MAQYYRGKYLIGLYDLNDNFLDIFDNVREMAKRLNITKTEIYCHINNESKLGVTKHKINGMWCLIKLIPVEELKEN